MPKTGAQFIVIFSFLVKGHWVSTLDRWFFRGWLHLFVPGNGHFAIPHLRMYASNLGSCNKRRRVMKNTIVSYGGTFVGGDDILTLWLNVFPAGSTHLRGRLADIIFSCLQDSRSAV
ncbi:unnamed protein product [Taenia asiatica]|uniref:Secreted protein n=1 Tax=Taenia asiatica TaxID=60517 RepID=A0A0R3WFN3_TAEAS|nr:unnamed protein product [Taenia asiatica]